ncbi:unnamed protein product [Diatraea saccharalis]|uniref:Uncharacterized protein n=1 Tax=Diatraea saccharalis TaxID=40085 RepID=A0A9N9N0V1_9NEOP|nr:unnamed protein product [Diatraea saccharalis]
MPHYSFRLFRELAEEMKIGWKEYWPFLDTFTDLRTNEGLTFLENYLKTKYDSACSLAYNDSCANSQLPDDSLLSRISLLNVSQISPLSPMSELCVAMNTCKISSDRHQEWKIENNNGNRQRAIRRSPVTEPAPINGETQITNHTVSRLLCIERTCQVFAKRIADALVFSLNAEPEVAGDSLKSEAKHLHRTMLTYMDDDRFRTIDFALVHSRLAQLVVFKLKQTTHDLDDVDRSVEFLMKLRCPNDDIFSSDDERKPVHYRGVNKVNLTHVMEAHVRCLASFICEELTENDPMKGPAVSEKECADIWEKASKCRCDWRVETLERNSKTNASFRKNRSSLFTSAKGENFVRRLSFDHEIGDGKLQNNVIDSVVSVNSPAGDSGPEFFTVNTDKCQVLTVEISEDESCESCQSESEDTYLTASEYEDDNDMTEASDRAVAETFIYGEEPTKMDRLVYDAICQCRIEPSVFPNVYRWRHTVALYTPAEREALVFTCF